MNLGSQTILKFSHWLGKELETSHVLVAIELEARHTLPGQGLVDVDGALRAFDEDLVANLSCAG